MPPSTLTATPIAVLVDVDGTLIDSNDAHASAWVAAFAEHGIGIDFAQTRRCIGMGGDKLMPEVSGVDAHSEKGTAIARRRGEIFVERFLPHLKPFREAGRLVRELKARGLTVVVASSATREELHSLLAVAGVESLMDGCTSSDDAANSKPDPDILHAALHSVPASPQEAVMIGDTPYDLQAAARAGVPMIAFRSGGWSDDALMGARAIYDGPWHLLAEIDQSPLGSRRDVTSAAAPIATAGRLHRYSSYPHQGQSMTPELARSSDPYTEGPVAKTIESQTAKLPSDTFLWMAVGSMVAAASLQMTGNKQASVFVGQWAPTLLILGLYNKLVKQLGSDRQSRDTA